LFCIIYHREVIYHIDEVAGSIHGTFAAGGAAHLAVFQDMVSCFQAFAGHP
jgi:hypothetical protein